MTLTLLPLIAATALALSPSASQSNTPTAAATLPNAFADDQRAVSTVPAPSPAPSATSTGPSPVSTQVAAQALGELIASIQAEQIAYSLLSQDLAAQIRQQEAELTQLIGQLGTVSGITARGEQDGAQLFEVDFENQKTQWLIAFDDNRKVALLLFRPVETGESN